MIKNATCVAPVSMSALRVQFAILGDGLVRPKLNTAFSCFDWYPELLEK